MDINQLNKLRIGYIPYSNTLNSAGDRRRFIFFAKKVSLKFELFDPKKDYDLVIACTMADPKLLLDLPNKTKLVFDFADAYLAENNFSLRSIFRGLIRFLVGTSSTFYFNYKNAFIDIIKRSDLIICSSPEQRKLILPFNKNVSVILDCHIEECLDVKKNYEVGKIINIGWEGQHATFPALISLIKKISETHLAPFVHFHIVTDEKTKQFDKFRYGPSIKNYLKKKGLPISFYPWSIKNMNKLSEICDFAILPVNLKNPMHIFKPENRLHLFWRLGLPVLASATESNLRAMKNCDQDLTATSLNDWLELIDLFKDSPSKISKYSKLSIDYINLNFSTEHYLSLWKKAFFRALG